MPAPDDDVLADRYRILDRRLTDAGFSWYEVSNWARSASGECRHNLAYWRSDDWWGIGPGAHSHVNGVRWWNVKHPARYAQTLGERHLPRASSETLTPEDRHVETVMLTARCREGLPRALSMTPRTGGRVSCAATVCSLLVRIPTSSPTRDVCSPTAWCAESCGGEGLSVAGEVGAGQSREPDDEDRERDDGEIPNGRYRPRCGRY